jgi:3-deoxy-7-phosphoheptulonate synthase/chorismate mutase
MNDNLQQYRQEIDKIDAGILDLLDRRMKLAIKIAESKKQIGKLTLDKKREDELFAALKEKNKKTSLPDDAVLEIWGEIIELSKKIQEQWVEGK